MKEKHKNFSNKNFKSLNYSKRNGLLKWNTG